MLIQRRPSCSTISTRGSAGPGAASTTPRARVARRKRGRGKLGIGSEWVVQHGNQGLLTGDSTQGPSLLTWTFVRGCPALRSGTKPLTRTVPQTTRRQDVYSY